jgi:hypothetical protein
MSPRWILCALMIPLADLQARADEPAKETVTVIKLAVQATPAPKPALKYLLLPELKEMQQGNPVPAFMKCFMEQNNFYFDKESIEKREKWLACPLAELPAGLEDYGGASTRQADYAARLTTPDWEILYLMRRDGINLLLPDLQNMRTLAAALKVRYRAQVKAGRFDDAVRTHQTLFRLARILGENPTLIGDLVGLAIASLTVSPFEEMIQQPGCPNYFWALARLPEHVVEFRQGMEGERLFLFADLRGLEDRQRVWDEDDLRKARDFVRRIGPLVENKEEARQKMEKWLTEHLTDKNWLAEARRGLLEWGLPEDRVKRYPPEQVVLQHLLRRYEIARDESMKWAGVPFWQAQDELLAQERSMKNLSTEETIATAFLPAHHKLRRAQVRFEQRLAMLRTIEALRLYAAENGGKLPQSLKDLKLPLMIDPVTGSAFSYKLDGATAVLQGTPPKGEEKNPVHNIRYEITIKK